MPLNVNRISSALPILVLSACLSVSASSPVRLAWCGMIDSHGRIIVPPKYSSLYALGPDTFFVGAPNENPAGQLGGKLVDREGKEIAIQLPPHFVLTGAYARKNGPVSDKSHLLLRIASRNPYNQSIVDGDGNTVIPARQWEIANYNNGYFIIDHYFLEPDPTKFKEYVDSHSEHRIYVYDQKGTKVGDIEPEKYIPDPTTLSEGVLCATRRYARQGGYVFLSVEGKELPLPAQADPVKFSEDYAAVHETADRASRMCFMNRAGNILNNRWFAYAEPFSGGEAIIGIGTIPDLRYGTIDLQGDGRLPPTFLRLGVADSSKYFAETEDHRWQVIDRHGRVLRRFAPGFQPTDFRGDLIAGYQHKDPINQPWNDVTGIVIDEKDRITDLFDGRADSPSIVPVWVYKEKKQLEGLRNKHGWTAPPIYSYISPLGNDRYLVRDDYRNVP